VRFTTKANALYAIFLGRPERTVTLPAVDPQKIWFGGIHNIEVLASNEKVTWRHNGEGITLDIPESAISSTNLCCVLKIT
jgi:hypothetical protein